MAYKELLVDPSLYDLDKPIADITEIRRRNPQRFEMEQLTAVVYADLEQKAAVGYKDVSEAEFWVRGHMPGMPLMPGVLMCEAAAQLTSFAAHWLELMPGTLLGLAGIESVKFRGSVRPGDRLIVQAKMVHWRRMLISAEFLGIVGESVICEGIVKGVPLRVDG
ncbi:MAG TPA: beta-hydroxyacyl-ACP dehydratase [Planctomycetaceae bacterium]|nr:beta-hydroxyacyl-ACP dehydratase [Planctomycetaceae bacterium]